MGAAPPNVLIAYDGSEPARRALDRVVRFMPHVHIAVVAVAAPVYRDPLFAKFPDEFEEEHQRKVLAEAKDVLAQHGIDAPTASPVGDAATEIIRTARDSKADLVVLGARGLNTLKRLVLGSVSTKVLHDAPCDVLVVK
jgi:nucleotide-binding universal stress UspA family protein